MGSVSFQRRFDDRTVREAAVQLRRMDRQPSNEGGRSSTTVRHPSIKQPTTMDKSLATIEERAGGSTRDRGGELRHRGDQARHQGGRLRRLPALEYEYYQVYHANGLAYCQCTSQKDADNIVMMESHRGSFWQRKVVKMKPTIDVESEDMGYEDRLKGQKVLDESKWTVL